MRLFGGQLAGCGSCTSFYNLPSKRYVLLLPRAPLKQDWGLDHETTGIGPGTSPIDTSPSREQAYCFDLLRFSEL